MGWFLYDRDLLMKELRENLHFFLQLFFVHRSAYKYFFFEYFRFFSVSISVVFLGAVFHLMWRSFQI